MNAVAIIPARGGSKGIPRKNVMQIGGKPLIAWSIEAAKTAGLFDRIVVSSDDLEILEVAKLYGAEAILRPADIAQDTTRSEPVVEHVLTYLKQQGYEPEYICYLQPTSPLRTAEDIQKGFTLIKERGADALIGIIPGDKKVLRAFMLDDSGYIRGVAGDRYSFMNRQELPEVYMQSGALYILTREAFMRTNTFFSKGKTVGFVMDPAHCIDIDTKEDVSLVEGLFSSQ